MPLEYRRAARNVSVDADETPPAGNPADLFDLDLHGLSMDPTDVFKFALRTLPDFKWEDDAEAAALFDRRWQDYKTLSGLEDLRVNDYNQPDGTADTVRNGPNGGDGTAAAKKRRLLWSAFTRTLPAKW